MSISVVRVIWNVCLFRGSTLQVLLAMSDFAHDDGSNIFPSIELLAAKSHLSIRAAQNELRKLEASGAIKQVTAALGRRRKVTEYRIDLERVKELQGFHQAENPNCKHCREKIRSAEKRARPQAKRVQNTTVKGADSDQ